MTFSFAPLHCGDVSRDKWQILGLAEEIIWGWTQRSFDRARIY
jgi:hypothetical protein